ncbi:acyltransferase family protein [Wenxinia marina]|uniref:Putative acyltransferase n=1 Tax=Wenxinia marina DSM 24838 TaxID=1123501 RepID=A0A0D0Q9S4_9RHOB|nr:acyltransferase [Wenxinia marina]KIQ67768.1 putative acyltransferase [Wenxinia marina DSM 24838]GGL77397.1 acyltransferase [Wenxinia marina]
MPRPTTVLHLQHLRGIAALMVVVHHVVREQPGVPAWLADSDLGRAGVLIFFVISGFVMMHTASDEPAGRFVARRIARVVPLYWAMTLVYYVVILRRDIGQGAALASVDELLLSLFFVPHYHTGVPDRIWPILVPGWTLNHEMVFYGLFAAGLALGRPRLVAGTVILSLCVAGPLLRSDVAVLVTWTSPLMLLFLAGMGLSRLWDRSGCRGLQLLLPVGAGLVVATSFGVPGGGSTGPVMAVGAVAVVAGALAFEGEGRVWRSRSAALVGDASYSIYLAHTIVLILVLKVFEILPPTGWAAAMSITCVLCVAGGIGCHFRIERPLSRAAGRLIGAGPGIRQFRIGTVSGQSDIVGRR